MAMLRTSHFLKFTAVWLLLKSSIFIDIVISVGFNADRFTLFNGLILIDLAHAILNFLKIYTINSWFALLLRSYWSSLSLITMIRNRKKLLLRGKKIIPVNIFRLVGMNVAVTFVDVEYSVFPSIKKKKMKILIGKRQRLISVIF